MTKVMKKDNPSTELIKILLYINERLKKVSTEVN